MTTTSTTPTSPSAGDHLRRWDAQQHAYIAHREARFDALLDTIALHGATAPRVLDAACGPGSLSHRVLDRFPDATLVSVDKDPALLEVARRTLDGRATVVAVDFEQPAWVESLPGDGFDAVVSSTALHWLPVDVLRRCYREFAAITRTGGLFLNADHLGYPADSLPGFVAMSTASDEATRRAHFDNGAQDWNDWWASIAADPSFATAVAERELVWADNEPSPPIGVAEHVDALRAAGYAQVSTVWQYFDDWVVAAIR